VCAHIYIYTHTYVYVRVVWQHALHRILVYGKSIKLNSVYFKELAGIYMAYGVAFVLNPLITESCIALGKVLPYTLNPKPSKT
jgi:hypothetical protein